MTILAVIILVILVLIRAVVPHRSRYSQFERERRVNHEESEIEQEVLRHQTYSDMLAWQAIKELVLVVALILVLVHAYGPGRAVVYGLVAIIFYRAAAQISFIRRPMQKLYDTHEIAILRVVKKLRPIARIMHRQPSEPQYDIASRDELEYVIEQSSRFLVDHEEAMIVGALNFADKKVRDYMTVRHDIDAISQDELLGPLVLNDLHETGHSQFPVMGDNLDQIVGVLNADTVLSVRDPHSLRANNAMNRQVAYVHEADTLVAAHAAILATKQHLLIVINADQETVGILSLSDITRQLFGSDIASECSDHESRTAVAARQPR